MATKGIGRECTEEGDPDKTKKVILLKIDKMILKSGVKLQRATCLIEGECVELVATHFVDLIFMIADIERGKCNV